MFKFWKTQPTQNEPEQNEPEQAKTTVKQPARNEIIRKAIATTFQQSQPIPTNKDGAISAMDGTTAEPMMTISGNVPTSLLNYYAAQSFIGYIAMLIMSQHPLIDLLCTAPSEDALRRGYELSVNGGSKIDNDVLDKIRTFNWEGKYDFFSILRNYGKFAAVYGYRIAIFKFDESKYENGFDYESPFDINSIVQGSYQGIAQPDPNFVVPEMHGDSYDPGSPDHYEPTYWVVGNKRYHKSHVIVYRYREVGQLLKPTYMYGGLSLTQMLYEAVYAFFTASSESNKLLMTKRLNVLKGDLQQALLDQYGFEERLLLAQRYRDNFGFMVLNSDESLEQMETGLAEVVNVIAQKLELACSIARIPPNRAGMQLQGFGSTGEAEENIYYDRLETDRKHCFEPVIKRHTDIVIRDLGIEPFDYSIQWGSLKQTTDSEQATINQTKAGTDNYLMQMGAIAAEEVRARLIADPTSGYNGLNPEMPEQEEEGMPPELSGDEPEQTEDKSVSDKQARFMQAAAHNADFAKKAGIPQSVAKEFANQDRQDF